MKKFKCKDCNRTFNDARALEQHRKALHRYYICPRCKIRFKSQEALDRHLANNICHLYIKKVSYKTKKVEPLVDSTIESLIIKRSEDLINEVPGFKYPNCGSEYGVYNKASAPLYSKKSYLIITCSRCGKGFRDSDL